MIGYIYIIRSKQTDKVYVGSTFYTLHRRFSLHKPDKKCTSQEILKYNDAEIELIECYECENREQLEKREGEYIKKYDCVNKNIAGRTRKEWEEDNKEARKEYHKDYREKNKEAIAEKKNEKFTCECGGKYTYANKSQHLKSKKHYYYF